MRPCVLILGMHRSGTSALAGALRLLGADLGSRLIPGREGENDKGFFEHLEINRLHRLLLIGLGRTWHDLRGIPRERLQGRRAEAVRGDLRELLASDLGDAPLWCVKDPRLCRLLPMWRDVLGELGRRPYCLIISRHPREVADSLAARDGFSAERSTFLWSDHNLTAELESRDLPRAFISYGSLLADPVGSLETVGKLLGLSWPVAPPQAEAQLRDFLSDRLRHHRAAKGAEAYALGRLASVARGLHRALCEADLADGAAQKSRFERARKDYAKVFGELEPLLTGPAGLLEHERVLDEHTTWLGIQAEDIRRQWGQIDEHERRLGELIERLGSGAGVRQPSREGRRELVSELGGLRSEVEKLSARTAELESGLEESQTRLAEASELSEQIAKLESRHQQAAERLAAVRDSLRSIEGSTEARLEELGGMVAEAATGLDSQTAVLTTLSDSLQSVEGSTEARLEELGGMLSDSLQSVESSTAARLEELGGMVAEAATGLDSQAEILGALHDSLERVKRSHEARLEEFRGLLSESATRLESQAATLDEVRKAELANEDQLAALQRALDERTAELQQHWQDRLETLRVALDKQRQSGEELQHRLEWQGESLVALRRDLEGLPVGDPAAVGAELQRLSRLTGKLENTLESRLRAVSLAEMMWDSKPWRLYLWFGRLSHALARRLRLAGAYLRPRRRASRPAAPAVAVSRTEVRSPEPRVCSYRLLIVDHRLPTPDKDSGSLRMWNLMTVLQELGFEITFLPCDLLARMPYAVQLREQGVEVVTDSDVSSVTEHLESRGARYDLVIVSRAHVAIQWLPQVRDLCATAKVIFDTVDLQYLRKERQAKLEGSLNLMDEARRLKDKELGAARAADATWVVSPFERDLLAREAPEVAVQIVSNIHVIHGRKTGFEERRDILFIGGFEHPPNIDAADWLVGEILPRLHEEVPDLRLFLVGSKPTHGVLRLASEHVTVTGYVPDVEPYFSSCRLSVAPLRYGAGVKGKVNQSMAYGVPCVVTAAAAEGMGLVHGADAMIGDSTEAFARCVLEAYRDPELWLRLSEGGLANVRKSFSFEAARAAIHGSLSAIGHPRGQRHGRSALRP